jgi:mRNA-degrading endonuclease toxin of MazEF toxin-antitoxin module
VLSWIVVAPVIRSPRPIPTHLPLGTHEGPATPCAAVFDGLQPIRRPFLTEPAGAPDPARPIELCGALRPTADG